MGSRRAVGIKPPIPEKFPKFPKFPKFTVPHQVS